jgi:hypothetical protein
MRPIWTATIWVAVIGLVMLVVGGILFGVGGGLAVGGLDASNNAQVGAGSGLALAGAGLLGLGGFLEIPVALVMLIVALATRP